MDQRSKRVAEVIDASSSTFTAQCYQLYDAPPLGAFVCAGSNSPVFGLVSNIMTGSIDPSRRPIARGETQTVEEDVYKIHPQLSQLLHTTFTVLVCGYQLDGKPEYILPPTPPRIHAFVYECSQDEIKHFTQSLSFIPIILDSSIPDREEVIAACLRMASKAQEDPYEFLVYASRYIALILGNQFSYLNAILRRIAP